MTATHSAGSVVPKATVATARGAKMQTAVRGLFPTICKERTEGDKKNAISDSMQRSTCILYSDCVDQMGRNWIRILGKIMGYYLTFATSRKPGFYVYSTNTT